MRFYPQEPLSWKNLQLGLLASPLYHISALIARKIPLAEARGIFPEKGYDGKPSECLSLFAVLMFHRDRYSRHRFCQLRSQQ